MRLSHTADITPISIPGSDVYVQVDSRALADRFGASEKVLGLAAWRAAKKTRDWLMTRVRRELAALASLPQRGIKGRFRRKNKPLADSGFAVLWIGLNPVDAARAGRPRQLKKGTRVGRHFFDKAFTAAIYSGTNKVWRRKGRERFPVIKMTVPLNDAMEDLLPKFQAGAERYFSSRLEHEVQYAMGLL